MSNERIRQSHQRRRRTRDRPLFRRALHNLWDDVSKLMRHRRSRRRRLVLGRSEQILRKHATSRRGRRGRESNSSKDLLHALERCNRSRRRTEQFARVRDLSLAWAPPWRLDGQTKEVRFLDASACGCLPAPGQSVGLRVRVIERGEVLLGLLLFPAMSWSAYTRTSMAAEYPEADPGDQSKLGDWKDRRALTSWK
jgi:hypothetical protein